MGTITFRIQKQFCAECSLALRRFIGNMDGVTSIAVENGKIAIEFDAAKIDEERVRRISKDSVERLGYELHDERE